MKRVRLTLFILTVLLMLTAGLGVNAEERVVKFQSGAETGKVTLRIWDLQTLEGVVKVKAIDGGEIHLESISVSSNDPGNTEICEASGNKVFMVSNGALIKTTITLDLSFVEDGEYLVTLSGGCTDKKGKYNAKGLYEEQSIIVGAPNTEEEEETTEETQEAVPEAQPAEKKKEESTTQTTTTETTKKTEEKDESTTIVRKPQTTSASDDEDEALKELVKEAEKNAKKDKKSGSSLKLKNLWWIILLLLILIALPILGYFLWKRKNTVEEEDYEGAADIDYDIEDDDMIEDDVAEE